MGATLLHCLLGAIAWGHSAHNHYYNRLVMCMLCSPRKDLGSAESETPEVQISVVQYLKPLMCCKLQQENFKNMGTCGSSAYDQMFGSRMVGPMAREPERKGS